ncbi:MAG: restriction endonuclease subunit S [Nitrospirae bacterium]|nr:restriction endonuclease subunit S [Magnetococcales bacterium]HAT48787.1 restriction endonuclease subunit S [Alphaproteobacteria bacterium]
MSGNGKSTLVPQLRFGEFREAGEWENKPLGELGDVLMCKRIFADETNDTAGVPFFKIGTLGGKPDAFISRNLFESYKDKYKYPRKGEILITCSGTVGKCLPYDGEDAYYQDSNIVWIDNSKLKISNEFLYTVLLNVNWGRLNSTTITRIYGSDLRGIIVSFPIQSEEQQKIADCLSSLDERITAEANKIDTLKAHKKGLMQQLFPAEGETVPRLRFGEFREGGEWEEKTLGGVTEFASGGTPSKDVPEYWGGTIPWISASSMYETTLCKSVLNITDLAIKEGARIAKKGTILILVRGSMLYNRVPMGIASIDVSFNQDVKALTIKQEIHAYFLLYQLLSYESRISIDKTGIGAGKIETDELKDLGIYIPSPSEQQKIADCLSSLDELITAQAQKLEILKRHKKGLMQQLFPTQDEESA